MQILKKSRNNILDNRDPKLVQLTRIQVFTCLPSKQRSCIFYRKKESLNFVRMVFTCLLVLAVRLRHLILEYKGKSIKTGLKLSKPFYPVIREHSRLYILPVNVTDLIILTSNLNRLSLIIAESLHILTMKPEISSTTNDEW